MARYDLQEGDGIHVESHTDLMLVMVNGRLTLPSFDVGAVNLAFHWGDTAYPVKHDGRGFFIEVDEETQHELQGTTPAAGADAGVAEAPGDTA
jgi:hypothetical protein